ncbi:hypothetical protein ACOSQ2_018620 [Xanthoceras sorbifolium]
MIASQAMISATFSCVKQSMALGCFPRVKIIHTSKKLMGQIYIPVVNWVLMIMCIVVVSILQSTTDIAIAYVPASIQLPQQTPSHPSHRCSSSPSSSPPIFPSAGGRFQLLSALTNGRRLFSLLTAGTAAARAEQSLDFSPVEKERECF